MPKSFVYRKSATKRVPDGAVVTTARGKATATWTARGGKQFRKPVHKSGDGGWRYRWTGPTYMAKLHLPAGGFIEEDTGCADKTNAEAYMTRRRQELEAEHANPALAAARRGREVTKTELSQLVDDFISRGVGGGQESKYSSTTRRYIEACIGWCAWRAFVDLSEKQFDEWRIYLQRQKVSPSTLRHSIGAVKRFSAWTARQLRVEDPLHWVDGIAKAEPLRPRRCLTPEDLVRLRAAATNADTKYRRARGGAESRTSVAEMNAERSLIYAVLFETGLRSSQLRRLHPDDLVVDKSGNASLKIANPKGAKLHKWGEVAISAHLAGEIQAHLAKSSASGAGSSARIFRWRPNMLERLRGDLERACIPVESRQGVVCLHSFRHSANAMLEEVQAPPTMQQRHLGHSTPLMSQTVYAKRREIEEVRPFIERIAERVQRAATELTRRDPGVNGPH